MSNAQGSDLSLLQFKQQVIEDYRMSVLGREMLRAALIEGDFPYASSRCDVAQVALARFVGADDVYMSAGLDIAYELRQGTLTDRGFFESLFASSYDDRAGLWARGAASQLSVAVGQALADAALCNADGLGSAKRRAVICTIGQNFSCDGEFYETVSYATANSLPLAIVFWNNGGTTSNGNLLKLLAGFAGSQKHKALYMEAVRGDDYAAVCHVMSTQLERTRQGSTTLTFVSGAKDDTGSFAEWLVDRRITTLHQLGQIDEECRKKVESERRGAYLTSLVTDAPLRSPRRSLADISALYPFAALPVMPMPPIAGCVDKAIGVAQANLLPVVEAREPHIRCSLLAVKPQAKLIVRTLERSTASIVANTPESTPVFTPADASEVAEVYRLLLANPIQSIVVEPGVQSPSVERPLGIVPQAGAAACLSEGMDLTIVAFGAATQVALDAIRLLDALSVKAELIHLCSLRPFDVGGLVNASLRRTKRLCVVDVDHTGRTADHVLASLAAQSSLFRNLLVKPVVVFPKSATAAIEAQDICKAASELIAYS